MRLDVKAGSGRGFSMILAGIALVLIISAGWAGSSAADFTAATIGDLGDLIVMETTGPYDADSGDINIIAAPRRVIATEFYNSRPDEYDFLVILTSFDFNMPVYDTFRADAFYLPVKNDVAGVGADLFDNSGLFGGDGTLQGVVDMGNIHNMVTDPGKPGFESVMTTLAHEILHRWGAYVTFTDDPGNVSDRLLGLEGRHWSFLLSTEGSVHLGNRWIENPDGTFTSSKGYLYYSPLDLYLMGLIPPAEVPPMLLIDNPDIDPNRMTEAGITISGEKTTVTIDDIIAAEGERIPGADASRKDFKVGFILAVRPDAYTGDEVPAIRSIIQNWIIWHSSLTHGKSRILVDAAPPLPIPVNPGGASSGGPPRETPPEIEDGVLWLMNAQEPDGSWADTGWTRGRDAAGAAFALADFEQADGSRAAGLQWLRGDGFGNTDHFSRKIIALSRSGEDVSGLSDALIAMAGKDGGWGLNPRYRSNPMDTALALKALAAAGFSEPGGVDAAAAYLKANEIKSGRWGGLDLKSSIRVSADVMTALHHYKETHPLGGRIQAWLDWLEETRSPGGGFGPDDGATRDTASALKAARELDVASAMFEDALFYILGLQSDDGSWGQSAHETALAVNALHAWKEVLTPDLVVHNEDLTFTPDVITRKPEEATVRVVVRNTGLADAAGVRIALYDGPATEENKAGERVVDMGGRDEIAETFTVVISDAAYHHFTVILDPDDEVEESSEINNTAFKTLPNELNMDPDLYALAGEISLDPPAIIRASDVIAVSVPIRNAGLTAAAGVKVALYDGAVLSAARLDECAVDVGPGAFTLAALSAPVNDAAFHRLFIVVDPGDEIAEKSESNNTVMTFLRPEITWDFEAPASDLSVSPPAVVRDETASLTFRVRNSGTSDAFNVAVRCVIDAGAGPALIGAPLLDIPSGAVVEHTLQWTASTPGRDQQITVRVDPDNGFDELSEENNDASILLTVTPRAEPDLRLSAGGLTVSPSPALEAGDAEITAAVHNSGGVDLENVQVDFHQALLHGEKQLLGARVIPLLPAGAAAEAVLPWTGIAVSGSRIITATADPENRITEYDETNNETFATLAILELPDMAVSPGAISFTPAAPKEGDVVTVRVVALNAGGQPATDVTVVASEEGVELRRWTIPLLEAHSGTTLWFTREKEAESGFHRITIHVDPLETTPDGNRGNNTAARGFGVQDADLWVSERYISPDGDGVRDETVFFFRLDAPMDATPVVVNGIDETIRAWTGPDFENTAGGAVTWNGADASGVVVPDGEYRIRVIDASGAVLGGLPVTVDNNRSPLALAFGTDHLLEISCAMACYAHVGEWLPDDSGVLYENDGLYIGRPDGSAPVMLGPEEWDNAGNWGDSHWTLAGDGEWIAFFYNPDDGEDRNRLWRMDRYGGSPILVDTLESTYYNRPRALSASPDGETLAYIDYVDGFPGNKVWMVKADGSGKKLLDAHYNNIYALAWSPDGEKLAYALNANPLSSIQVTDNQGAPVSSHDFDASSITDMHWLADGKMLVYRKDGSYSHRVWLVDAAGGGEPILLPVPCGSWEFEYEISPDKRRVAFFCNENDTPVITLTDLSGNAATLHQGDPAEFMSSGLTNWDPKITWSYDSRKIAFIDYRRLNAC
ncbi:MAG: hypothetical protein GY859_03600, partial [Desulfobacterales bacterium]|nr:hypothetical protein [Desulfobacterales bacterium]